MVGGVNNLRLQFDLVTNILAIADLADFPLFLSHSTPPVYKTNCMTIKKRLPVTGVIYWHDKPPIADDTYPIYFLTSL
jgi:hypothetical protein